MYNVFFIFASSSYVIDFNWSPSEEYLCLVTGNECLYIWYPNGSFAVKVPEVRDFRCRRAHWNAEGNAILLLSASGTFTVCYLKS
jgi:hypothetical protein